jgi:hypothetical protein
VAVRVEAWVTRRGGDVDDLLLRHLELEPAERAEEAGQPGAGGVDGRIGLEDGAIFQTHHARRLRRLRQTDAELAALADEGPCRGGHRAARQQRAALRLVERPRHVRSLHLRHPRRQVGGGPALDRDAEPFEGRERVRLEPVVAMREPDDAGPHEEALAKGILERAPLLQGVALPARIELVRSVRRARDARLVPGRRERVSGPVLVDQRDRCAPATQPERRPGPEHARPDDNGLHGPDRNCDLAHAATPAGAVTAET